MKPKFYKQYVMIEWDSVMNLNLDLIKPLFNLIRQTGFVPKIFTFRKKEQDNHDIFEHFEEQDILFSGNKQKKDMLIDNGLKEKDIAYWIENDFSNVVDKNDLSHLSTLINQDNLDNVKSVYKELEKTENKYVLIDWDETMSLNSQFAERFFDLFKRFGFIPKIYTARKELDDNSDIFLWINKEDVIFSNRKQKKDTLYLNGIPDKDIAFWLDDMPSAIINKQDFYNLFFYFND